MTKSSGNNDGRDKESSEETQSIDESIGHFAFRIRRKLKEHESQKAAQEQETIQRHGRILQAVNLARKIFIEASKLPLPKNWIFTFEVGDSEGWPRLMLGLLSGEGIEFLRLTLSAHDRLQSGMVSLTLGDGKVLSEISMRENSEIEKFPHIVKKAVRDFLELATAAITKPAPKEDNGSLKLDEPEVQDLAIKGEVFQEDQALGQSNRIEEEQAPPKPLLPID